MLKVKLLCLLVLVSLGWRRPLTAVIQAPTITFTSTTTTNNFPTNLTFSTTASSAAGDIVSAKLIFTDQDGKGGTQNILTDIEASPEVTLTYVWDTSRTTVVPSQPVYYYWQVVDSEGNRVNSELEAVRYDDIRFDWQVLENEAIAVWWHDQPADFGQTVFNIAHTAFSQQRELFQTEPELQIRIIIYNNFDEFAAWHSFVNEFIGGQAFPGAGVTTQIVPPGDFQEEWLLDVLPHEIAHLYFFQATRSLSSPPLWLNEGLAQYLELDDNTFSLRAAELAVLNGDRIPLYAIIGSFGNDEDAVRLSYAESLSAVTYLIEAYGEEGLAALLAAYKSGLYDEDAFQTALGVSTLEFEYEWIAWLGAPLDLYPTPTAEPTLAPLPTFPMMVLPTKLPTNTPTATATAIATTSSTATAVPANTNTPTPTITKSETPTAVPTPTAINSLNEPELPSTLTWLGIGLGLILISSAFIALRRA